MTWTHCRNALTPALALQAVVIVGGTLITTGIMKLHGYPDATDVRWNPVSELVRNWGWVAVVIPAIWFAVVQRGVSQRGDEVAGMGQGILAGAGVLILLVFYFWTATTAAEVRVRIVPLDSLGWSVGEDRWCGVGTAAKGRLRDPAEVERPHGLGVDGGRGAGNRLPWNGNGEPVGPCGSGA